MTGPFSLSAPMGLGVGRRHTKSSIQLMVDVDVTHWFDTRSVQFGTEQTLPNRMNPAGASMQRGATSGADTTDPALTLVGDRYVLDFDASNDYMLMDLADFTGSFTADETVMFVGRVPDGATATQALLATRVQTGGGNTQLGMLVRVNVTAGTSWSFLAIAGDGTNVRGSSTISGLVFGTTYLIGYRYDHTARTIAAFAHNGTTLTAPAGVDSSALASCASGTAARIGTTTAGASPFSGDLMVPFLRSSAVLADADISAIATRLIAGSYA